MPDWRTFKAFEAPLIAASANRIALASAQGSIQLLDTASGKDLGQLDHDKGPAVALAFSLDGRLLASSHGSVVQVWDVAQRKVLHVTPDVADGAKYLCFAPGDKLLLAGKRSSRLWDVAGNKLIRAIPLAFDKLRSVTFSPDGRLLAYGDANGGAHLWDVEQDREVLTLPGLKGYVSTVTFSPDGRLLGGAGWRSVKIWEIISGRERRTFQGFEADAWCVAFSADGRQLASSTSDNNILIWDIPGQALTDAIKAEANPKILDSKILASLWQELAADDGGRAHHAIWGLVGREAEAVPYLKTVLKPFAKPNADKLDQFIKDLDDDSFAVREKAAKELQNLGEMAEPALRKLLANPPSLEAELRAKTLLAQVTKMLTAPALLQQCRAVEALEHMATPAARQFLQELSAGAPGARLTREASAALRRLQENPVTIE